MTDVSPTLPSDEQLAAEIVNFDPVYDVPSPVEKVGDVRLPEPSLTALPPEAQDRIRAKLAKVTPGNRDLFEAQYIRDELYAFSSYTRVKAGVGEGANAYQREFFALNAEVAQTSDELTRLSAEIDRKRTIQDPATGQTVELTDPYHGPDRLKALQAEFNNQLARLHALDGPEKERRLEKAKAKAVADRRAVLQQIADHKEIDRRAAEIVRNEKIENAAEARAKRLRSSL